MTLFVYYRRHHATIQTSYAIIYAIILITIPWLIWQGMKTWRVPLYSLILVQIGIFLHFTGGLTIFGPERIYLMSFYGVGYDKIVHFYNAFAGVILASHVFSSVGVKMKGYQSMILILVVLGAGAIVEIIEYTGLSTLPKEGEWKYAIPKSDLYDNNLQDMVANLFGGVSGAICLAVCSVKKLNNKSNH